MTTRAFGKGAVGLLAVALFAAVCLLALHGTAAAQDHSAARGFSSAWVEPGGRLEVTIAAEDYGAFGQVVETLPAGFGYEGSSLSESAVSHVGRTVAFTLLESGSFSYTVTAPVEEGTYTFSGVILNQTRQERPVAGDSEVRVGASPGPAPDTTPEPTPAPAPEPAATSTTPTATSTTPAATSTTPTATSTTPAATTTTATATATPEPTATPTPVPTATPTPEPTTTPTPAPTATATFVPTPTFTPRVLPTPRVTTSAPPPSMAARAPEPTPAAEDAAAPGEAGGIPSPSAASAAEGGSRGATGVVAVVGVALLAAAVVVAYALARRRA